LYLLWFQSSTYIIVCFIHFRFLGRPLFRFPVGVQLYMLFRYLTSPIRITWLCHFNPFISTHSIAITSPTTLSYYWYFIVSCFYLFAICTSSYKTISTESNVLFSSSSTVHTSLPWHATVWNTDFQCALVFVWNMWPPPKSTLNIRYFSRLN